MKNNTRGKYYEIRQKMNAEVVLEWFAEQGVKEINYTDVEKMTPKILSKNRML